MSTLSKRRKRSQTKRDCFDEKERAKDATHPKANPGESDELLLEPDVVHFNVTKGVLRIVRKEGGGSTTPTRKVRMEKGTRDQTHRDLLDELKRPKLDVEDARGEDKIERAKELKEERGERVSKDFWKVGGIVDVELNSSSRQLRN